MHKATVDWTININLIHDNNNKNKYYYEYLQYDNNYLFFNTDISHLK